MEKNRKLLLAGIAVALGAGLFWAGRYTAPVKIETKIVDRIVKVQETKKDEEKKAHVVTNKHKVVTKKPDGTVVIVTDTNKDNQSDTVKHEEAKVVIQRVVETHTVTTYLRPDWRVGLLGGVDISNPLQNPFFGGHVEHRFIGPLYIGAWGLSNKDVGVSLTLEF